MHNHSYVTVCNVSYPFPACKLTDAEGILIIGTLTFPHNPFFQFPLPCPSSSSPFFIHSSLPPYHHASRPLLQLTPTAFLPCRLITRPSESYVSMAAPGCFLPANVQTFMHFITGASRESVFEQQKEKKTRFHG